LAALVALLALLALVALKGVPRACPGPRARGLHPSISFTVVRLLGGQTRSAMKGEEEGRGVRGDRRRDDEKTRGGERIEEGRRADKVTAEKSR
jgi:hypothetical protein